MAKNDIFSKVAKLSQSYQMVDNPEFTKTGSVVMDALLGGGVPKGSFILWSSQSGIGKTTGSLYICKSYCMQGKKVLYLDYEGGVNDSQLSGIGLKQYQYSPETNPNGTFFVFRVHTFADAEAFLDELLEDVDLLVIDSVTAMLPGKLAEKSVEDVQPGVQARMMASLLLKYKARSMKKGVSWIMINQVRTHIRFVGQTTEEEAGGNALKFYADYRILMKKAYKGDLERTEKTARGDVKVPYGAINEVWCIKSRYSRPFIPLNLSIIFGKGISNNYAYLEFLNNKGCISKAGAWFTGKVGEHEFKVQGEQKVLEWIQNNREIVRDYINSNGGYKLLVNEGEQIVNGDSQGGEYIIHEDEEVQEEEYVNMAMGNIDDEDYNG